MVQRNATRPAGIFGMVGFGLIILLCFNLLPVQAQPGMRNAVPASAGRVLFLPAIFSPPQPPPPPATPISVWSEMNSPAIINRGDRIRVDISVKNESTTPDDATSNVNISVPFDTRQLRFFTYDIDEGRGDQFLGVSNGNQVELFVGRRIGPGKTHTVSVWFNVQDSVANSEYIELQPRYTYNSESRVTNKVGVTVQGGDPGLCRPFEGADARLQVQPDRGPLGIAFIFNNDCYLPGETVTTWLNDPFAPGGVRELPLRATANDRGEVWLNLNSVEYNLQPDDRYALVAQGLTSGITSLGPFIVTSGTARQRHAPSPATQAAVPVRIEAIPAQQPVPTGSISGQITGDDGSPLAGVLVAALDAENAYVERSFSAANGRYSLTGLADGDYTVAVLASLSSNPVLAAYAGAFLPAGVSAGADTTVDAQLQRGGAIQGTVRGADSGNGLPGVAVFVFADSGRLVGAASTDATGAYTTTVVLSGSYRLEFEPAYSEIISTTNYLSATLPEVNVTAPAPTTGIDVNLELRPDVRTISGQVTAQDSGLGLAEVLVVVRSDDGRFVEAVETGPNGGYRTGVLEAGTYQLEALTAFTSEQLSRSYIGRSFGTPIDMTAAGPRADVDVSLERGAQLSGRVTAAETNQELPGVLVIVRDSTDDIVALGLSNAQGTYVSSGLVAGDYSVRFSTAFAAGVTGSYQSLTETLSIPASGLARNIALQRDPARIVYLPLLRNE